MKTKHRISISSRRLVVTANALMAMLFAPGLLLAAPAPEADVHAFDAASGMITWSNTSLNMYTVEWSPGLTPLGWYSTWDQQGCIVTTSSLVQVPVPMHYRVGSGYTDRAFEGCWMVYADGNSYMKCNGKGLVDAFGSFMEPVPVGDYSVDVYGTFTMNLYEREGISRVSGHRHDIHNWIYVYAGTTGFIRRVKNPGALEGTWRGRIGPYTNVVLHVRHDGFMPSISNLIDVSVGAMYVDVSNSVGGFIYTGHRQDTSEWNRVHISAKLINPTNIFGDYGLDWEFGFITAGVDLKKQ